MLFCLNGLQTSSLNAHEVKEHEVQVRQGVQVHQGVQVQRSKPRAGMARIRWVKQFPSSEEKKKKGILKWVADFFWGNEKPVLQKPVAILADNPENFWVLDQGNQALIEIKDKNTHFPAFLQKKSEDFPSLVAMCMLPADEMLFTDSQSDKIYKVSADKKYLRVFNDTLALKQPTGIAYSKLTKQIWVIETKAHRIAVLDEKGNLLKYIGKRGTAPGTFNYPTHIWIDKDGNVYIVDSLNYRIQIFNKEGVLVSVFGEIGDSSGYLARPKGIAVDSHGNIYVADALSHVIQIFDREGKFLYYFGRQGHAKNQFWMPAGLYIDQEDYIYIADSYNARVQIFQLINANGHEKNENY